MTRTCYLAAIHGRFTYRVGLSCHRLGLGCVKKPELIGPIVFGPLYHGDELSGSKMTSFSIEQEICVHVPKDKAVTAVR